MKYFLDTDTLIYFLKGHKSVVENLSCHSSVDLATTIINHSELLFGVFKSVKKKENLVIVTGLLKSLNIVSFCEDSSAIFAEQKAALKNQGTIIADMDLMIACIALRHKAVLVTNNTKHFERIKNIKLDNWCVIE
ncbi:MAG: PIN domain-containing protein [Tatlockia sp.]|nr:PIN domain-containing protein [Tatlockia sp.]